MTTRQSRLTQAQKNMVAMVGFRREIADTAANRRVAEQLVRKGLLGWNDADGQARSLALTTDGLACFGDLHNDTATMAAVGAPPEQRVAEPEPAPAAPEAFTMDDAAQAPAAPAATPARRRGGVAPADPERRERILADRRARQQQPAAPVALTDTTPPGFHDQLAAAIAETTGEPAPQPEAAPEPIDAEWPEPGTPSAADARELAAPAAQEAPEAPFTMDDAPEAAAAPTAERDGLTALDVEALRAKYLEVVGRPTGSTNKAYLIWKIREVQKGRIAAGPTRASRRTEEGATPRQVKVLPVGLDADIVEALDAAWKAAGYKSRMECFRKALIGWAQLTGSDALEALLRR